MKFNPLNLADESGYQLWREQKIRAYENATHLNRVDIEGGSVSLPELEKLRSALGVFNYSIYRVKNPHLATKQFVRDTGLLLGLDRLDGNLCSDEDNITSIQVKTSGRHAGYIPYTSRQLTWHTDGYYNKPSQTIRAMVLHCVRPAIRGGENLMLDHEMAYIQLRDENVQYIRAFMQDDALVIPPNIENGREIRGAQSGPVFSMDVLSETLHMRYSARTRNIEWKTDALTQEALSCMKALLNNNNPYVINYRMQAGEGIIANNVLHNRTAFEDAEAAEQKRLLYRARYYDRVADAPWVTGR